MSSELTSLSQTWNIRGSSMARSKSDQVAPVAKPVEVGSMFPGYSKAEELSRGNQGIVYRAIQDGTHRKVAIKLPLYAGRMSEVKRRRFFREIELIARISHPNIVQIFHSGVTSDGAPFYVMDFIDGVPLDQYVRDKHLSIEQLLELMRDICLAMDHAHRQSVVHRDLKPSNILVESDGKPTIVDFGLAKLFEADREALLAMKDDAITGKQDVIGTMRYMSPEHARGTPEKIEPRSDVYSLGVILYELLTGQLPYPEVPKTGDVLKYMDEFLRHVIETPAELPRKKWESGSGIGSRTADGSRATKCPIDSELETIVLCALAKEVGRRYQSAGAMADDIGRYLAGEAIIARAPSPLYQLYARSRLQVRRHPLAAQFCTVIVSAFMAFLLVKNVVYQWSDLQRTFLSAAYGLLAEDQTAKPYEYVATVVWREGTDLAEVARELNMNDFDSNDKTNYRLLYSSVLKKLSEQREYDLCKAVVIDHRLKSSSMFDPVFIEGVKALRARNIPVIVGVPWQLDTDSSPTISPNLADHVRFGAPDADTRESPWKLVLAAQREGNDPRPNLVLEAYAATKHPDSLAEYRLDLDSQLIEIKYWGIDRQSTIGRKSTYSSEFIEVSQAGPCIHPLVEGKQVGDLEFAYFVDLPGESWFEKNTIDVLDLLRGDEAILRALRGKIIVLGTERKNDHDIKEYNGRPMAGVHGIAAGIEAVSRHRFVRLPSGAETKVIPIAASIAGASLGAVSINRRKRIGLFFAIAIGFAACFLIGFKWFGIYADPLVPGLAIAIAVILSSAIRRVYVLP